MSDFYAGYRFSSNIVRYNQAGSVVNTSSGVVGGAGDLSLDSSGNVFATVGGSLSPCLYKFTPTLGLVATANAGNTEYGNAIGPNDTLTYRFAISNFNHTIHNISNNFATNNWSYTATLLQQVRHIAATRDNQYILGGSAFTSGPPLWTVQLLNSSGTSQWVAKIHNDGVQGIVRDIGISPTSSHLVVAMDGGIDEFVAFDQSGSVLWDRSPRGDNMGRSATVDNDHVYCRTFLDAYKLDLDTGNTVSSIVGNSDLNDTVSLKRRVAKNDAGAIAMNSVRNIHIYDNFPTKSRSITQSFLNSQDQFWSLTSGQVFQFGGEEYFQTILAILSLAASKQSFTSKETNIISSASPTAIKVADKSMPNVITNSSSASKTTTKSFSELLSSVALVLKETSTTGIIVFTDLVANASVTKSVKSSISSVMSFIENIERKIEKTYANAISTITNIQRGVDYRLNKTVSVIAKSVKEARKTLSETIGRSVLLIKTGISTSLQLITTIGHNLSFNKETSKNLVSILEGNILFQKVIDLKKRADQVISSFFDLITLATGLIISVLSRIPFLSEFAQDRLRKAHTETEETMFRAEVDRIEPIRGDADILTKINTNIIFTEDSPFYEGERIPFNAATLDGTADGTVTLDGTLPTTVTIGNN